VKKGKSSDDLCFLLLISFSSYLVSFSQGFRRLLLAVRFICRYSTAILGASHVFIDNDTNVDTGSVK